MLVAVVALVVVAVAVAGTVRALAGPPAVPPADAGRPGDVLLVPGYGGSTTALDALAGRIAASRRIRVPRHRGQAGRRRDR